MKTTALTEAEFSVADRKVSALHRVARKGTEEERAQANETIRAWEAAYALPQATWQQRQVRHVAIAEVAARFELLKT